MSFSIEFKWYQNIDLLCCNQLSEFTVGPISPMKVILLYQRHFSIEHRLFYLKSFTDRQNFVFPFLRQFRIQIKRLLRKKQDRSTNRCVCLTWSETWIVIMDFNHEIFCGTITGDRITCFFGIRRYLVQVKLILSTGLVCRFVVLTWSAPIAQAVAKFSEHILVLVRTWSHTPSGRLSSSSMSLELHSNRSKWCTRLTFLLSSNILCCNKW